MTYPYNHSIKVKNKVIPSTNPQCYHSPKVNTAKLLLNTWLISLFFTHTYTLIHRVTHIYT